jgi:hypothetical protein
VNKQRGLAQHYGRKTDECSVLSISLGIIYGDFEMRSKPVVEKIAPSSQERFQSLLRLRFGRSILLQIGIESGKQISCDALA